MSADIQNRILPIRICDKMHAFAKEGDAQKKEISDGKEGGRCTSSQV